MNPHRNVGVFYLISCLNEIKIISLHYEKYNTNTFSGYNLEFL